jgi:hypothetical protein
MASMARTVRRGAVSTKGANVDVELGPPFASKAVCDPLTHAWPADLEDSPTGRHQRRRSVQPKCSTHALTAVAKLAKAIAQPRAS